MRTVTWGTFAIAAILAFTQIQRVALDQPAREISSTVALQNEALEKTTHNVVDPSAGIHELNEISKVISSSSSNRPIHRP